MCGCFSAGFSRAGFLGLGGLTLPWLLRTRAEAAALNADFVRDKAVVLVFLAGGASHIETFNPNMDAAEPYRSLTGEVKTTLPGVTLGGTFPGLAKHARKMAIVRSFKHRVGSHEQAIVHVLTGGSDATGQGKTGFSMGSAYSRCRGSNHERTGLPTYCLLTAPHKDGQYSRELQRVAKGSHAGTLGAEAEPFSPGGNGPGLTNMRLHLPVERLEDRRLLLRKLDSSPARPGSGRRTGPVRAAGADASHRRVPVRRSICTQEDRRIVERYDTGMFQCGKKVFEPSILGKQMLMARRLIEAGAGFVTVQSAGWDMHADGNNPGVKDGMEMLGRPLDKALSAFLEDVEQRGLLDKVLLVVTGDFGRTPKINKREAATTGPTCVLSPCSAAACTWAR